MRKLIILLAIAFTFTANAQEKGDWYVGTGDVANVSWTEWAISPSLGYAFTDDLVVGFNVSQVVDEDMEDTSLLKIILHMLELKTLTLTWFKLVLEKCLK